MANNKYVVKNKLDFLDKKIPLILAPLGILTLFALWEFVTFMGWVSPLSLPRLSNVLKTGWQLLMDGTLWVEVSASLKRIVLGYIIGCTAGVIIGILFGMSKISDRIGMPIVNLIYPIPKIAILPLIMLWLGIGEISKVTIISVGVFFPIVYNTYMGVAQTNRLYINGGILKGIWRCGLRA